ncbi:tRNA lysidine(34) synthetase TilS [Zobellia galactanivorans]|uniref:tRNA lysidine(34) synthetase TilS n=1 Tax=Zobellia galactanivorans (strain DSM 12802 / CCUG 47099 / CIP 106680 / NCIMB 13871 / Dsij) TaxID=63186 RepID=UPI0026E2D373|nr:tRNA lysidine(34) synthetase TilS [Zobellia galactanivorans]MDO6808189.1 tRNA lysidine(34) synthetase TilS [Zobellia galactanivorans]
MLEEFKKHIEDQFTELVDNRFLLACSGGVDSVVLLHLCARLNLDFAVAHCNFNLRGAESDADEGLVRDLAKKHKVKIYVTRFDTKSYSTQNKVSIQVAARELRYRWFSEIMDREGIKTLVTAHHADDSLETFLINLSRGTGIDGLTGIPVKSHNLSRPLLHFTTEWILSYARAESLVWREDASNADTKYLRNKIRHEIVPALKELNPAFLANFQKTQNYLSQTALVLEQHISDLKSQLFEETAGVTRISVAKLLQLKPVSTYLYLLFKPYGFTEWNDVENLLSAMSGKQIQSKDYRLVKDRDYLLLVAKEAPDVNEYHIDEGDTVVSEPVSLKIEKVGEYVKSDLNTLYIDKKALKYPLTIRKWKKGDYFYPLGMTGKKKLSKYFKDEKVDVVSKEAQWLLCSGDAIVWVIGRRADERFKVSEHTSDIIKITLNQ